MKQKGRDWSSLQTACTHPAWDGLDVKTNSPDVREARKVIMGLMLSRTPNVPIIQELAAEYGVTEPPFEVDDPKEKCILCGLCVRVCNDMVQAHVLNFSDRGVDRKVGPPFMEKTRQCIGCGACTIVCPTGAIEIVLEEAGIYAEKPLGPTAAIYVPFLQAVPRVPVIDTDSCIRFRQQDRSNGEIAEACGACQTLCEANAIDFTQQDEIVELNVGAIVVATGFQMWDSTKLSQYSYGKSPNIITALEFERLSNASGPTGGQIITADGEKPERVAIIHCVGSRDKNANAHEYCSRICCMYSLKQAHLVRDKTHAEVYEFYMDMRAFGKGYEEFYERVQEEGVVMVRGRGAEVQVLPAGKLRVTGEDANLGKLVRGGRGHGGAQLGHRGAGRRVAGQPRMFGLSRTSDGWFAEAHPKLRPVETNTDGVFLAGCAQGPKDVPDTVAHAGAAASMVLALLCKGEVTISPQVAHRGREALLGLQDLPVGLPVHGDQLHRGRDNVRASTRRCARAAAPAWRPARRARSRPALHRRADLWPQIEGLFRLPERRQWSRGGSEADERRDGKFEPRIVGFLCNWCTYTAADTAGVSRMEQPPNVDIIRFMCTGRIEPAFILKAFAEGADGVIVSGCHPPGDCHYTNGNFKTFRRMPLVEALLAAVRHRRRPLPLGLDLRRGGSEVGRAGARLHRAGARPGAAGVEAAAREQGGLDDARKRKTQARPLLGGLLWRLRDRRRRAAREAPDRGSGGRYPLLALRHGLQVQGCRGDAGRAHRRLHVQRRDPHQRERAPGPPAAPEVEGAGGVRLLRLRGVHPRPGQPLRPPVHLRARLPGIARRWTTRTRWCRRRSTRCRKGRSTSRSSTTRSRRWIRWWMWTTTCPAARRRTRRSGR